MADLPKIHLPAHPEWEDLYNATWNIHKNNIRKMPACTNPEAPYYVDENFTSKIFVWDTMFMMMFDKYGINQFPTLPSIDNFYYNQEDGGPGDGYICREIIEDTGEHYWSHYDDINGTNPPLFAWAEWEQFLVHGDKERFNKDINGKTIYERLVSHYNFIEREKKHPNGLYGKTNGYGNGLDDTPNQDGGWLIMDSNVGGKQTYNDLSIQQAQVAHYLSLIANELGKTEDAAFFESEHQRISGLINELLWNEEDSFYYNLDEQGVNQTCIATPTGLWALAGRVAPPERAEAMVRKNALNSERMFRPSGLSTVTYDWGSFTPAGGYWNGSVWAPTAYQYIKGLHEYGMDDIAFEEAVRHVTAVNDVFQKTGTLWENYAPDYPSNGNTSRPNFVGWTGALSVGLLIENIVGVRMKASEDVIDWNIHLDEEHGVSDLWMGGGSEREPNRVSLLAKDRPSAKAPVEITVECVRPFTLNVTNGDVKETLRVEAGTHSYTIGGEEGNEPYLDSAVHIFRSNDLSLAKDTVSANAVDFVTFTNQYDETITDGLQNRTGNGTIYNVNTIGHRNARTQGSPIMESLGYTGAQEVVKTAHDGPEGFTIMAPADNRMRTLKLIVGVRDTDATVNTALSDASQPRSIKKLSSGGGEQIYTVTIPYQAASDNRYLLAKFTADTTSGEISLKGIILEDGGEQIMKAPESFTVTPGDGQAVVNAQNPEGYDYSSYRVYVGESKFDMQCYETETLPFTIPNLENFKSYYVSISGMQNGTESTMSEHLQVIPEPAGYDDNARAQKDLELALDDILNGNTGFDAITGPMSFSLTGEVYGSSITVSASTDSQSYGIMNDGGVVRPVAPMGNKAAVLTIRSSYDTGEATLEQDAVVTAIDPAQDAYVQGSAYGAPYFTVDLSGLGSKDWMQFQSPYDYEYARKNSGSSFSNFRRFHSASEEMSWEAPLSYTWSDAGDIAPASSTAIIAKGLNSGFDFQVPYSENTQVLKLIGGVQNARGQLDFIVNGKVVTPCPWRIRAADPGEPLISSISLPAPTTWRPSGTSPPIRTATAACC